jgi:hypothetical protein
LEGSAGAAVVLAVVVLQEDGSKKNLFPPNFDGLLKSQKSGFQCL